MKYFLYIMLLYGFLPFNLHLDLIVILVFFIAFKEDERFALLFSFLAGILIDLYYPAALGINALIYVILMQALLYFKKYIVQNLLIILANFAIFYFAKTALMHLAIPNPPRIEPIIITIIFFLPIFLLLNGFIYKTWMKV